MRMSFVFSLCLAIIALLLSACGTMQPGLAPAGPRAGLWSLEYRGNCSGREAERLQITRLDADEIAFDDFRLRRDAAGDYVGSATFFAPMPADGRDIPYEIRYRLRAADDGGYLGTETIVEGGGHGLDCPVALVFIGDH